MNKQIDLIKKIISTKKFTNEPIVYSGMKYLVNVNLLNNRLTITFSFCTGPTVGAIDYDLKKDLFSCYNAFDSIETISNFSQLLRDYEEMDCNQFILTYGKDPLRLSSELYDMLNIFITDRSKQTPKVKGLFDVLNPIKFFKSFTKTKML